MSIGGFAMSLLVARLPTHAGAHVPHPGELSPRRQPHRPRHGAEPRLGVCSVLFVGGAGSAFQTLNNAVAVRLTSPGYHGRVMGLMFLAWGLMNITSLPVGYLADILGERAVLSGSGAILCVVVGLLYLWRERIAAAERATA